MGLVLWFFHFLPWSGDSQKCSRGNSLLLETTHASASALCVWIHLFQICQKKFWNAQTKSPWLMAAACFISLQSHTRRPSTTISFLFLRALICYRYHSKNEEETTVSSSHVLLTLSRITVRNSEKNRERLLPQHAVFNGSWRTTACTTVKNHLPEGSLLQLRYYAGHFHSCILHFIYVLSLCQNKSKKLPKHYKN